MCFVPPTTVGTALVCEKFQVNFSFLFYGSERFLTGFVVFFICSPRQVGAVFIREKFKANFSFLFYGSERFRTGFLAFSFVGK